VSDPPTLDDLQDAGIYSPDAADADDLAYLLGQLIERGATEEEIRRAYHQGTLAALLLELRLVGQERLNFDELAAKSGADPKFLRQVWRAAGFGETPEEDRRFSVADVEIFERTAATRGLLGDEALLDIVRAMGIGLAKAAEASVAGVRSQLDYPAMPKAEPEEERERLHEWIDHDWNELERLIGLVFRHQSIDASRRFFEWHVPPSPHNVVDIVVGFVDLVGSTETAENADLSEFAAVIRSFESIAAGLIIDNGATLVKLIGDAAMFVTHAPGAACELGLELVETFADHPIVPPCKVGLAAGPTVAQRGDFFGPTVNLAARLCGLAGESAVLVAPSVKTRVVGVTDDYSFLRMPTRRLAGIERRLTLWELGR
jgi:adenylate cyclase